jgi:hypothetical protein
MPSEIQPPTPLSTSGRRALAASIIDAAGGQVTDGLYVAELLDALSTVVLRLAHLSDDDARVVLATLWAQQ